MRPFGRRTGGRLARLSAFAVLALALVVSGAGTASATVGNNGKPDSTGNNGTLKVHEFGTPTGTENNDPKVCIFNLEGFNFDPQQELVLKFEVQGGDRPTGQVPTPNEFNVKADENGYFSSIYFNDGGPTIVAGHYKVVAYGKDTGTGEFTDQKAKSKVFKVRCGAPAGDTGTIKVTKALDQSSAPAGDRKFAITVTCDTADYSETFHLKVNESGTTDLLPVGTVCVVTEKTRDGWQTPTITPEDPVTVVKDMTVTITVTNFKPKHEGEGKTGTLKVSKTLAAGTVANAGQTFPITVTCEKASRSEKAGYSKTFTFDLAADQSHEIPNLKDGAVCTVSEAATAGWNSPTFVPPTGQVEIDKDTTVEVTVVNSRAITPPPNPVQTVSLGLIKANSPTVDQLVKAGSTITYTLTATAGGTIAQTNVVVSDVVPTGTTYIKGSAACVSWTPCTVTEPTATPKTVSWALGTMYPSNSATVTFKVTVNSGLQPNTLITNVGTVTSSQTSAVSNETINKLTEVKGEVIVGPTTPTVTPAAVEGETLPATGAGVPVGYLIGTGVGLIALGALLTALTRRSRSN